MTLVTAILICVSCSWRPPNPTGAALKKGNPALMVDADAMFQGMEPSALVIVETPDLASAQRAADALDQAAYSQDHAASPGLREKVVFAAFRREGPPGALQGLTAAGVLGEATDWVVKKDWGGKKILVSSTPDGMVASTMNRLCCCSLGWFNNTAAPVRVD